MIEKYMVTEGHCFIWVGNIVLNPKTGTENICSWNIISFGNMWTGIILFDKHDIDLFCSTSVCVCV